MACVLFSLFSVFFLTARANDLPELRVAAYDTLLSKKGALAQVLPAFERECRCRVRGFPSSDSAQLISRIEMEKKRGKAFVHIAIGADLVLWERAQKTAESWGQWKPKGWERIQSNLKETPDFLPLDQGVFAWMADTDQIKKKNLSLPKSIRDLTRPEWKKNLILEDPRTSSPGLAFLGFTHQIYPDRVMWEKFWKNFRGQWLTLTPGWDSAYGLFLREEAPLVWSYTTSQSYHRENGDQRGRFQAIHLEEGSPVQVEGAWLVKDAWVTPEDLDRARLFLEYLIRPEVQVQWAKANWMMPVVQGLEHRLPQSYRGLSQPKKTFLLQATISQTAEKWVENWKRIMVESP